MASTNARPPVAWRNKNPGNIRYVPSIQWQGQVGPGDGGFVRFRTAEHGFRALARQVMTYKERDRLDTVRKILTKWAPPVGYADGKSYTQNTEGYILKVARDMGVGPDDALSVQDADTMFALVKAIADYEDGAGWTWDDETIREGLRMAGFDLPPPPLHRTPEAKVGASAIAATTAGAILQDAVPHLPVLGSFVETVGPWIVAGAVALIVAWIALRAYERRRGMAE